MMKWTLQELETPVRLQHKSNVSIHSPVCVCCVYVCAYVCVLCSYISMPVYIKRLCLCVYIFVWVFVSMCVVCVFCVHMCSVWMHTSVYIIPHVYICVCVRFLLRNSLKNQLWGGEWESQRGWQKSIKPENSQMICSSIYHTKQLNSWPTSLVSHVMIYSWLSVCLGEMEPFKGHLSTG